MNIYFIEYIEITLYNKSSVTTVILVYFKDNKDNNKIITLGNRRCYKEIVLITILFFRFSGSIKPNS